MGVSGCGKSTVGRLLAARLGLPFLDADEYHPPENVAKMAAGVPLGDADRWPWLERLNAELAAADRSGPGAVLACSALKAAYRDVLRRGLPACRFVHLRGSRELIAARLAERRHRYMPASLLDSQFAALEPPGDAIDIDVAQAPQACVEQALAALA